MPDKDDKHPQPDNVIRFPVEAVKRFGFKRADHKADTRTDKMELEGQLVAQCAASPDGREGIQAFVEKRKPDFNSRS